MKKYRIKSNRVAILTLCLLLAIAFSFSLPLVFAPNSVYAYAADGKDFFEKKTYWAGILKADIDLEGIDWQPIGSYADAFEGTFINPQGFAIKNLTVTSSENVIGTRKLAGLFGVTRGAFVKGLILENVFIDIPDTTSTYSTAGGIAAESRNSFFYNCKVEGMICSSIWAGGLTGYDEQGIYKNCEFNGIVTSDGDAGGIIGWCYAYLNHNGRFGQDFDEGVFDSKVNADIVSTLSYAGGIYGNNRGNSKPVNCTFSGNVSGGMGQGEMYGYNIWP